MFCRGRCEKCGLLDTRIVERDGKPESLNRCVFKAILDSLVRLEQGQIRIQAAIETDRNEAVKANRKASEIIGTGFIALTYAVQEDERAPQKLKILKDRYLKLSQDKE